MQSNTVIALFRRCGALLEGHFRLASGLHSSGYLQCALLLQNPDHTAMLAEALAEHSRHLKIAIVLSPALGGVVIGYEIARALGARALFVERQDERLTLRRGFRIKNGERVLVAEDVITTGGSTRETIKVAESFGGQVVGIVAIVNRGDSQNFHVPFYTLADIVIPTYAPEDCPLCARGILVSNPGSSSG